MQSKQFILNYIKQTKNTVVYGNEEIQSVYLPKDTFEQNEDTGYPSEITITVAYNN